MSAVAEQPTSELAADAPSFPGRTALVTGGTRGIGLAIAQALARQGAQVSVTTRHAAGTSIPELDGQVVVLTADPSDPADMQGAVVAAGVGQGLDLCIANAGTAPVEDFLRSSCREWEECWRANVQGVLVTLQAAARAMCEGGRGGRLLVTASITGLRGAGGMPVYSATKGALLSLVESLALDLAPHNITVNALAPGVTDTRMLHEANRSQARRQARSEASLLDELLQRIPLGRLAAPEDIAALACFLLSEHAGYITGTTVRIDGGLLLG